MNWKTKQITYEGFPLMLRYRSNLASLNRSGIESLVMVTHYFAKVGKNGLPDAEYNAGLYGFDRGFREAVEAATDGVTVLIETFAGKRHYYVYAVLPDAADTALSDFSQTHPGEKLEWSVRRDPGWSFFNRHALHFGLEV